MDPPILMSHTGSGGMTSSLSVGTAGSANVRRLLQYPLSPILNTGRSNIKMTHKLEDPRFGNMTTTATDLRTMAGMQWPSRSRPVHDRAVIEAALKQME